MRRGYGNEEVGRESGEEGKEGERERGEKR